MPQNPLVECFANLLNTWLSNKRATCCFLHVNKRGSTEVGFYKFIPCSTDLRPPAGLEALLGWAGGGRAQQGWRKNCIAKVRVRNKPQVWNCQMSFGSHRRPFVVYVPLNCFSVLAGLAGPCVGLPG